METSSILLKQKSDLVCRTLLDVPEVRKDLWEFMKKFVAERLDAGSTMLALIDSSKLHPC